MTGQIQKHDAEQAKLFFDRWHVYQQVVADDYMSHRGIHAAIRKFVTGKMAKPYMLLDLGCGDASAIAETFSGTGLQSYTGVDVSPAALEQAAINLATAPFGVRLVEGDLAGYAAGTACFDVVLAGFSLHHLYPEEKRAFFRRIRDMLKAPGYLLLYDVFRRPGESREEYMQAYCSNCAEHWSGLPHDGLANLIEHIKACDFPETYAALANMASEAGFTPEPGPLFADAPQFHCLYSFRADAPDADQVPGDPAAQTNRLPT